MELASGDHAPDYSTFVVGPRQPCVVRYRRKCARALVAAGQKETHSL